MFTTSTRYERYEEHLKGDFLMSITFMGTKDK